MGVRLRLLGRISELGVIPQALGVGGRVPVGERLRRRGSRGVEVLVVVRGDVGSGGGGGGGGGSREAERVSEGVELPGGDVVDAVHVCEDIGAVAAILAADRAECGARVVGGVVVADMATQVTAGPKFPAAVGAPVAGAATTAVAATAASATARRPRPPTKVALYMVFLVGVRPVGVSAAAGVLGRHHQPRVDGSHHAHVWNDNPASVTPPGEGPAKPTPAPTHA